MVVRPSASGKVWSNLSPNYRARLERNGVTRTQYERGDSLKGARGHANTPENPAEALRNPDKYEIYIGKRDALIRQIEEFKRQKWGSNDNYNANRARRNISHDPATGKERSLTALRQIAAFADEDDYDTEDMSDDIESAFYYH